MDEPGDGWPAGPGPWCGATGKECHAPPTLFLHRERLRARHGYVYLRHGRGDEPDLAWRGLVRIPQRIAALAVAALHHPDLRPAGAGARSARRAGLALQDRRLLQPFHGLGALDQRRIAARRDLPAFLPDHLRDRAAHRPRASGHRAGRLAGDPGGGSVEVVPEAQDDVFVTGVFSPRTGFCWWLTPSYYWLGITVTYRSLVSELLNVLYIF